jgi:hypothetical protein
MDERDARENSRREMVRARIHELPEAESNAARTAEQKQQEEYEADKRLRLLARGAAWKGSPFAGSSMATQS